MSNTHLKLIPSRSSSAVVLDLVDPTASALDQFIQNQNSNSTRKVYQGEVEIFFRFTNHISLDQVRTSDILKYKASLERLKPSTVHRKLVTLRCFFQFCRSQEFIDQDPTEGVKVPKQGEPVPRSLSLPEVKRLFSVMDQSTIGLRDRALFNLMLQAGLRRDECRRLDFEHIDHRGDYIRLTVQGKGSKIRTVDISLDTYRLVTDYVESLGDLVESPTGAVFRADGKRISNRSVNARLRVYSKRAGVPCSPHQLRHSFSFMVEQNGGALEDLRRALGHSSLAVTQQYINRGNGKRNTIMDFVPSF